MHDSGDALATELLGYMELVESRGGGKVVTNLAECWR